MGAFGFGHRRSSVHRVAMAMSALATLMTSIPAAPRAEEAPAPVISVGQGLEISPHRLVFGAQGGQAQLELRLPAHPARFHVVVEERVMLEDGRLLLPDQVVGARPSHALLSALDLVHAAPETLSLAPGKPQAVTVRVAAATGLAPGDYRAHVTFSAERPLAPAPGASPKPRYNLWDYSVPVIVRVGPADVRAGFSDIVIERQTITDSESRRPITLPILSLRLERLGRTSLFGDVIVTDGDAVLGRAEGVGVYPEIDARQLKIPLIRAPAPGDRLTVVFVDRDVKPGAILAQASGLLSDPAQEPREA